MRTADKLSVRYIGRREKASIVSEIKTFGTPIDPNVTLNVENDRLEELLVQYASEKTGENLGKLVAHMQGCRVLVPANVNSQKQPIPCYIRNSNNELFLPIYTNKSQIPAKPKSPAIINIPYPAVNQMAVRQEGRVSGIVINPFSNNLIFKPELLRKIDEVSQAQARQPQTKKVQMTEPEYIAFEQKQFQYHFLPKRFFSETESFLHELCEEKAEKVDKLYEEAYQQKRLYPYLTEDFSVMVMNISEELLMVLIDFPIKNVAEGACYRVYLTWDASTKRGRYFTFEKGPKDTVLGEITGGLQHIVHGQAPVEGAEIQKLLDLIEDEKRHTS